MASDAMHVRKQTRKKCTRARMPYLLSLSPSLFPSLFPSLYICLHLSPALLLSFSAGLLLSFSLPLLSSPLLRSPRLRSALLSSLVDCSLLFSSLPSLLLAKALGHQVRARRMPKPRWTVSRSTTTTILQVSAGCLAGAGVRKRMSQRRDLWMTSHRSRRLRRARTHISEPEARRPPRRNSLTHTHTQQTLSLRLTAMAQLAPATPHRLPTMQPAPRHRPTPNSGTTRGRLGEPHG